jgi:hypothetical protein
MVKLALDTRAQDADHALAMIRHYVTGDEEEPRIDDPRWDRVYGSLIFERTRPLAARVRAVYPGIVLGHRDLARGDARGAWGCGGVGCGGPTIR